MEQKSLGESKEESVVEPEDATYIQLHRAVCFTT